MGQVALKLDWTGVGYVGHRLMTELIFLLNIYYNRISLDSFSFINFTHLLVCVMSSATHMSVIYPLPLQEWCPFILVSFIFTVCNIKTLVTHITL